MAKGFWRHAIKVNPRGPKEQTILRLTKAQAKVKPDEHYLIWRHSWFRPGAHGYTYALCDAGTFVGTEARDYLVAEGVQLVPLRRLRTAIEPDLEYHRRAVERLEAMLELANA